MPTQTITYKWSRGSETFSQDVPYTADGENNGDIVVPIGATNLEVDIAWAIAKLVVVVFLASQNLTIKTNSTGSPQETIALIKDSPLIWGNDSYFSDVFAGNVTKFYVTNASGIEATLKVRSLSDITP